MLAGGAGFIGSHLADRLIDEGYRVVAADNLMLGREDNIRHLLSNRNFRFIPLDLSLYEAAHGLFEAYKFDAVFHLAANSDIQASAHDPTRDLKNTFITSSNLLECMREFQVKEIIFASSSAVYGHKPGVKISEDSGSLWPVSYYGGAKLASEAFIASYCYMNNIRSWIFRFPNVVGGRLTHGVVFDFITKLIKNPTSLTILGNGQQSKPYLYIDDLIDAIFHIWLNHKEMINCFNIGVDSQTTVTSIANIVCEEMGLQNVKYIYSGGNVGWRGDVPEFQYDLTKIHDTNWQSRYTSDEALRLSIRKILNS